MLAEQEVEEQEAWEEAAVLGEQEAEEVGEDEVVVAAVGEGDKAELVAEVATKEAKGGEELGKRCLRDTGVAL